MSEANKEEVEKCKQIAQAALAGGDAEKASRFLQKAKRMCPTDTSIDDLLAKAASGANGGSSPAASPPRREPSAASNSDPTASEGPRHRSSGASNVRTTKDGKQYTSEQMQLVQRILRTKDYYDILEVPKNASEDAAKKAYRKLALKLHPDKNSAPGADEAFKKLSKAFQCLTDPEKKQVYDRYGDEERMPQQQRHHYQQDFMTPEDLFAAFFGGGPAFHHHHHGRQHHHDDGQMQRVQIFQALPVLLLVLLTLASNFAAKDGGSKFSFQPNNAYRNERSTATLNVAYYVTDDFEEHYNEGTRTLAEFDRQVEIYHIRSLHSDCDYQEKTQYKKVLAAKRRGSEQDLQAARNLPRPACKDLERVKKKYPALFRSAMFMGGY